MTTDFKTGADLADVIKGVLNGDDVRCAVAFWGGGSDTLVGNDGTAEARLICDVTLGGTSARALRDLGAPDNKRLRHVPGLHAKVYISDAGAVVCSANASRNGIGIDGPPGHREAGVVLSPDEDAFTDAAAWFEETWLATKKVGHRALAMAARRFRPRGPTERGPVRPGSLLSLIAADPERFAQISIVLTQTDATDSQRKKARHAVKAAHPGSAAEIDEMPANGMFMGWDSGDLDKWSRTFIELWMPKGRLHAYGRRAFFFEDTRGVVLSRARWPAVQAIVGDDLPTRAQIAKEDADVVRRLLDRHGDALFDARELAAAVEAL